MSQRNTAAVSVHGEASQTRLHHVLLVGQQLPTSMKVQPKAASKTPKPHADMKDPRLLKNQGKLAEKSPEQAQQLQIKRLSETVNRLEENLKARYIREAQR